MCHVDRGVLVKQQAFQRMGGDDSRNGRNVKQKSRLSRRPKFSFENRGFDWLDDIATETSDHSTMWEGSCTVGLDVHPSKVPLV